MNCPKCSGAAMIPGRLLAFASTETNPNQLYPCDYAGCHAGQIHCCDGLQEDEWTLEFRWIGHNEEIPEGFELSNEKEIHHSGRDKGVAAAISSVGGVKKLATKLGIKQPSVSNWKRVPAERVISVEKISGVSRTVLRPDLYPSETGQVKLVVREYP
jgi:DNA-binding transcriptional regulator YdaS (Cro superfamily)